MLDNKTCPVCPGLKQTTWLWQALVHVFAISHGLVHTSQLWVTDNGDNYRLRRSGCGKVCSKPHLPILTIIYHCITLPLEELRWFTAELWTHWMRVKPTSIWAQDAVNWISRCILSQVYFALTSPELHAYLASKRSKLLVLTCQNLEGRTKRDLLISRYFNSKKSYSKTLQ